MAIALPRPLPLEAAPRVSSPTPDAAHRGTVFQLDVASLQAAHQVAILDEAHDRVPRGVQSSPAQSSAAGTIAGIAALTAGITTVILISIGAGIAVEAESQGKQASERNLPHSEHVQRVNAANQLAVISSGLLFSAIGTGAATLLSSAFWASTQPDL